MQSAHSALSWAPGSGWACGGGAESLAQFEYCCSLWPPKLTESDGAGEAGDFRRPSALPGSAARLVIIAEEAVRRQLRPLMRFGTCPLLQPGMLAGCVSK